MKNLFFCMATLMALALGTPLQGQTTDKERLKANLERAFAPQPSSEKAEASLPQDSRPDTSGVLYYVQVLASVRPIEGTGDRALRVFPDLKSVKEGRYLKYYTGAGTSDYRQAQAQLRAVQGKGYPQAFLIAFRGGVKIPLEEALASQK